MASDGVGWASDKLYSRPEPTEEAAPYWAAFLLLSRDRPEQSISMGMAGGLTLPRPIPRETIRREGERLGYVGDGLEDFVEIVMRVDDLYIEVTTKRIADETRAAAARGKKR